MLSWLQTIARVAWGNLEPHIFHFQCTPEAKIYLVPLTAHLPLNSSSLEIFLSSTLVLVASFVYPPSLRSSPARSPWRSFDLDKGPQAAVLVDNNDNAEKVLDGRCEPPLQLALYVLLCVEKQCRWQSYGWLQPDVSVPIRNIFKSVCKTFSDYILLEITCIENKIEE